MSGALPTWPDALPEHGGGDQLVGQQMQQWIDTHSAELGNALAFAHMDPPTSNVAASVVGWNAMTNQNLLHPDLSPLATRAEKTAIDWLLPYFGMHDGHCCSGSTLANLTALWCAREHGAKRVVASADAHISVAKSAHILGMPLLSVPVNEHGCAQALEQMCTNTDCLVATAGTTARGVIDPLQPTKALWLHVDAAWAGPLRLTRYANRLDGIELADSVAVSAHKWFYQPKDSAVVLFKDPSAKAHVSFGGAYLATPNVGLQGSKGAQGLALLATLMSQGRQGLAAVIENSMRSCEQLASLIDASDSLELRQFPETGVLNWRPKVVAVDQLQKALVSVSSTTLIDGELWFRQVAANPNADVRLIMDAIQNAEQQARG